jgi:hypothetical protein
MSLLVPKQKDGPFLDQLRYSKLLILFGTWSYGICMEGMYPFRRVGSLTRISSGAS